MKSVEFVRKAIEKCEFLIDEELISGVDLVKSFLDFLVQGITNENKFYGVALHTGSKVFDAAVIVFASFTNLVNNTNPKELISTLNIGDSVLYKNKRWTYKGKGINPCFPELESIVLEGMVLVDKKEYIIKEYVPEKSWNTIIPYNGSSTRKDGRGIHKKEPVKELFYKNVLDYATYEISHLTDTSSVIILSKARADIIEKISIRFQDKTVKLLDLITATYYAENSKIPFPGNIGQNEPIIKFTSKASVARKLIKQKDGNEHIGLIVTGNNTIGRNYNELQELTTLRSLKYVLFLTQIDSEYGQDLLNLTDNTKLFACTKSFLKKHDFPILSDTGPIMNELYTQMEIISNCERKPQKVSSDITWEQFKTFKQLMIKFKHSDFYSQEIESFVINAYSLMNLFLTSVFSIGELERQIEADIITTVISPSTKLEELEKQKQSFPKSLSNIADEVIQILQRCWIMLADKCEKEYELLSILRQNHDKRIAVVVPKEYYATVLQNLGVITLIDSPEQLTIITANQFDHTQMYDLIICSGLVKGRHFDTFRCCSAKLILSLVYDFENKLYARQMKYAQKTEEFYNKIASNNTLQYLNLKEELHDMAESDDTEVESLETISYELDEYINKLQEKADLRLLGSNSSNNSVTAQCIASAVFENNDRCFFTKRYKAYVIDKATGEAYEKDAEKLSEGDSLIFTINNDNTRDIVDDMLQKLIGNLSEKVQESYRKSKEWKIVLKEYTEFYGSKGTVKSLKNVGIPVQDSTIRHWLDADSHQVGVQKIEYFKGIGQATGHTELYEHPDIYYNACADIKRVRGEILKYIGEAIIKKIQGIIPKQGDVMAEIYDRLDSSAVIMQIESIREVNMNIPINLVNRPITIKE